MTTEIAIMNKIAVALAADSAVTIQTQEGLKVFNTVNKLFMLSKYHPVGIMVYGSAELMRVPWETIIKIYRKRLDMNKYNTLKQYADNFIEFLNEESQLFPESIQENHFSLIVRNYFTIIKEDIDKKVKEITTNDKNGIIDYNSITQVINVTIENHYKLCNEAESTSSFPDNFHKEVREKYSKIVTAIISEIFKKLPLNTSHTDKLIDIGINVITKRVLPISGIVITGFGEEDTFPSLFSFSIEAILENKLKYKQDNECKISLGNSAWIIPFAQSSMVATFMEGVDPNYNETMNGYLSELFDKYPDYITQGLTGVSDAEKKELVKKLRAISHDILKDFWKDMQVFRSQKHINPIINAVTFLPKDELAAMAESLVHLTSLKQRISMDAETVGGPIDVAIISKGDGFVWIKRKHYFTAELNPYFFANYFRKN